MPFWAHQADRAAIKAGALVVPAIIGGKTAPGYVMGTLFWVTHCDWGTCSLRRVRDGAMMRDVAFHHTDDLRPAAERPATGLPLHVAVASGCSPEVVAALVALRPEAAATMDDFGRFPLQIAAEVPRSPSLRCPLSSSPPP